MKRISRKKIVIIEYNNKKIVGLTPIVAMLYFDTVLYEMRVEIRKFEINKTKCML